MGVFNDLTNKYVGKKFVTGISRRNGYRIYWNFTCSCGVSGSALAQSIKMSSGCRFCSFKNSRPNRRKRPYEAMYNTFKNRARYSVYISYEEYLKLSDIKECHYCNSEIIWKEYRNQKTNGGTGSNLDRKDNDKPYSIDNVVVCCGRCNYAKGSHFTYSEWKQIGKVIMEFKERNYKITPQTRIGRRALANLERELTK